MSVQYPGAIITWVDRVDNVDYNYAGDINSAIAEIQGIAKDLVGVGGTAGGLAQGGASFYARWVVEHNTDGTHKNITTDSVTASGNITASTFTGNLTGAVTGNASTATTSPNHSGTYEHDQAVKTTSSPTFASVVSGGASAIKWKIFSGTLAGSSPTSFAHGLSADDIISVVGANYNGVGDHWTIPQRISDSQLTQIYWNATDIQIACTSNYYGQSYRVIAFYA